MSDREPPRRDACGVPRVLGVIAVAASCATVAGCSSTADTEIGVYEPASAPPAAGGSPAATPATGGGYPYDPKVHFMWPESPPQHGMCAGGFYVGSFSCTLDNGSFTFPIEGKVDFTLTQSTGSEFLVIEDGLLEGLFGVVTFRADLAGQLDCGANHLEANASNGVFVAPPFIGAFDGVLAGDLDRSTQTLSGHWSLASTGIPPCVGEWKATRQP